MAGVNPSAFPKRGRARRDQGDRPYHSYDGTKAAPSTPRLCTSNISETSSIEEWTDWTGTGRTHRERCMSKADASVPAQKEARPALPLIRKGATRAAAAKTRSVQQIPDLSDWMKTSQKRGKVKPQPGDPGDMTPWVKATPSETSLTALLQTLPSPPTDYNKMADQRASRNAASKVSWGQPDPDKTLSRAKPKGRTGVTKRRTAAKIHSIKLPPVPAVTELNFSRNFSFSFFQLPSHQSPQHWQQRQRSVCLLVRKTQ